MFGVRVKMEVWEWYFNGVLGNRVLKKLNLLKEKVREKGGGCEF